MRHLLITCVVLAACASELETSSTDQALISDGSTGGTYDFFFQPPLVPVAIAPADPQCCYLSRLRIELWTVDCDGLGELGFLQKVWRGDSNGEGDDIHEQPGGYKVVINVGYPSGTCFRIFPQLDGVDLGFRDVAVLSGGAAAPPGYKKWGVGTNQSIVFKLGDQDPDTDGVINAVDNCVFVANPGQADGDGDGQGDACEGGDTDGDGVPDAIDNCPAVANPNQLDSDGDGFGNACEACPVDPLKTDPGLCGCGEVDTDLDGDGLICDDPCIHDPDNDADGDGMCGDVDACPLDPDNDVDADGVCGNVDNCPAKPNPGQEDGDGDGQGDACEPVCLSGILGQWTGDDTAEDSRGSADGTWTGIAAYADAVVGRGFQFTSSNHVNAVFTRTGAWSVSMWARSDTGSQPKNYGLLASSVAAAADTFQIDWGQSGYRLKVGNDALNVSLGSPTLFTFHHLAVTYSAAGVITTYRDGIQVGTATWTGAPLRFTALKIGTNRGGTLRYIGVIDDVAILNRVLSPSEVSAIHAANTNGLCP